MIIELGSDLIWLIVLFLVFIIPEFVIPFLMVIVMFLMGCVITDKEVIIKTPESTIIHIGKAVDSKTNDVNNTKKD